MSLPVVIKLLEEANDKIYALTEERNKWQKMYADLKKELTATVLCMDCETVESETPEGKTFESCFSCLPDEHKKRLYEKADTEAHYWRECYEQLFTKYQDEFYRHDARGAYDTCR